MGVQLYRVPAGWQHPTDDDFAGRERIVAYGPPRYAKWRPQFMDESWDAAMRSWWWERVVRGVQRAFGYWPSVLGLIDPPFAVRWRFKDKAPKYWNYRPRWRERTRTHYQLYETVSEGTPISPVCSSIEQLADWCAVQTGKPVWVGTEGMTRDEWLRFFSRGGWAPSAISSPEHGFEHGIVAMSRPVAEGTR